MKADTSDVHEVDVAGLRVLTPGERLSLRMELKAQRKKIFVTGFQSRVLCALANVHSRTLIRWREGRSRPKQTKRIEDAIAELGWTSLLDVPLETRFIMGWNARRARGSSGTRGRGNPGRRGRSFPVIKVGGSKRKRPRSITTGWAPAGYVMPAVDEQLEEPVDDEVLEEERRTMRMKGGGKDE